MTNPQVPPASRPQRPSISSKGDYAAYLTIVFGVPAVIFALILVWGFYALSGPRDHFAQIGLKSDLAWYQTYSNRLTREMQDRDLLFYDIGRSIDHARKADIILVGHSVLEFGLVWHKVDAFARKHGVKIYNLTSPGLASGAYTRQLIKRHDIRAKLWVLNADDLPESFFNPTFADWFGTGQHNMHAIMEAGKLRAYLNVARRGIRWRLETAAASMFPNWLLQPPYRLRRHASTTWRNIETGQYYLDEFVGYLDKHGPLTTIERPHCETSPNEIENARNYVSDIGGTALLTLVPFNQWCPDRLRQIADALDLEYFLPGDVAPYSTLDGRHMDLNGAIAYTDFFLESLGKSRAFQLLIGAADPGPPLK